MSYYGCNRVLTPTLYDIELRLRVHAAQTDKRVVSVY